MEPFRLGHRKALDGVRGLAILLVLVSHIPSLPLGGGFIGVDLFFVLSGFLITSLLLEEWQVTGAIGLGAFYSRRALRLLPALLVLLGVVVAFSEVVEPQEAPAMRKSALMTLFYSANWFLAFKAYPRLELSATWSLSVEEQFYIVWPILLLLLFRAGWSRRVAAGLVIGAMVGSAALRAYLWTTTGSYERVMFGTDTHADGLLAGALAAMTLSWRGVPTSSGTLRALNWAAHLSLGCILVFVYLGWSGEAYMFLGGYLALNLAAAVLVVCLVTAPWAGLRRLFEFGPLVGIGRISYGVYLWHIAVFWVLGRLGWPGGWAHWPAAIGLTIAVAALSFFALERPILRFKSRFERVRSEGRSSP